MTAALIWLAAILGGFAGWWLRGHWAVVKHWRIIRWIGAVIRWMKG